MLNDRIISMNKFLIGAIIFSFVILLFLYSKVGFVDIRTDSHIYINQIKYFDGNFSGDEDTKLRSFKPFYGFVGSLITPLISEENAVALINLIFYFGITLLMFFLLKEFGFSDKYSMFGSMITSSAYPVLKYGLSILTDISGWFFAILGVFIFIKAIKKDSRSLFFLGSIIAFIGSMCKETGALGLIFVTSVLFLLFIKQKSGKFLKFWMLSVLPFVLLQGIFLFLSFRSGGGGVSFIEWFLFNKNGVGYDMWNLYYLFFTEASTFNFLWVYILVGLFYLLKTKNNFSYLEKVIGLSMVVSILPIFVWPVFMTRVLFVEYIITIPIAILGLRFLSEKFNLNKYSIMTLAFMPIIFSVGLFIFSGGGSLFDKF